MGISYNGHSEPQIVMTRKEPLYIILHLKYTLKLEMPRVHKERILKALREKCQVIYKGEPNRITANFSTEILKSR
jgi:hypothetical protein